MTRPRLRDLGYTIGVLPPGLHNALTDVPGVRVGHTTLIYDTPAVARTGVTVILAPDAAEHHGGCFAGSHSLNGNGEMTGLLWIDEGGALESAIAITNTHQVGVVRDALIEDAVARHGLKSWMLPVVAETYDGLLNDIAAFHVTRQHVFDALATASTGPVAEGNVGGGAGMICHEFKGGIGTSSRIAATPSGDFVVGALVQANYGRRQDLRLDGVAVGAAIGVDRVPSPFRQHAGAGSIIVIVATNAPLGPHQCRRLAQRAGLGVGRVGGLGQNSSGDIFLAFATGNRLPLSADAPIPVQMLPNHQLDALFRATVEAVEESIWNALIAAETTTGFQGHICHAIPHDELHRVMAGRRLQE